MTALMLNTPRLYLYPCDLTLWEAVFSGNRVLSQVLGVNVPRDWIHDVQVFRPHYLNQKHNPAYETWGVYLMVHRADALLIGTCGFKGPPTPDGRLEIGYGVRPGHRNQGLTSEAVRVLLAHAFADERVEALTARTLPEASASVSILKKMGFVQRNNADLPPPYTWLWELVRS